MVVREVRRLSEVEIRGPRVEGASERVLTPEALAFVGELEREFGPRRRALLAARAERRARLARGEERLDFPTETASLRSGDWQVAPVPADLQDRRVEITGPVERKMMINALNSGARVFMADFEDALSPTWANVVAGQANVQDAVRRRLAYTSPDGRAYRLDERIATLLIRPRGWHLEERHLCVDGAPVSASLFDFGLWSFHNAAEALARGSGPYLYLPKLESRHEARLWNDVFVFAQDRLGVPQGSIRATVLVETILAAFEMEEILWELRDHVAGLNAGRWDYLFSLIKTFRDDPALALPDRAQLTMTVPFMRAYTELLVRACHRHGAHAIGGMAAFIPSRRDPEVNERALAQVRADKEREAGDGFDGTWVAHPDLVPVAGEVFDPILGAAPHQKARLRDDVVPDAAALQQVRVPDGRLTEAGLGNAISVALQYLAAWLGGNGAVAINDLMEDAATAEIARSLLWHWRSREAVTDDGSRFTAARYHSLREAETTRLRPALEAEAAARLDEAAGLLDGLVLSDDFTVFLTLAAYPRLA